MDDPGAQMAARLVFDMMKNPKNAGASSINTSRRSGGHGNSNGVNVKVNLYGTGPVVGGSAAAGAIVNSESLPRSSQVSVPDTKEQRERFFIWLQGKMEWQGKIMDIQAIRVAFDADDLSLWQIGRVPAEDWRSYGLRAGHRERVQLAVQSYKER